MLICHCQICNYKEDEIKIVFTNNLRLLLFLAVAVLGNGGYDQLSQIVYIACT